MTEHDQERIDIATLKAGVEQLLKNTECLPELCLDIARHDERIKTLEQWRTLMLGILSSVSVAVIVLIIQQIANAVKGG